MKPLIVIIHPEGNLNNNPNLTGIVEIFCEKGYEVDIYSRKRPDIPQEHPCRFSRLIVTDIDDPLGIAVLFPAGTELSKESVSNIRHGFASCSLIIGIDRGIIEAAVLAEILKIPYGLISYEILFSEETGADFIAADRAASQGISFAICQDSVRSHHLSRENLIPLNKIIDIPVAGRGFCGNSRTYLLHDSLGISHDVKLALYIGSISCEWSGIEELLESSKTWPDDWALVLHQRYSHSSPELEKKLSSRKRSNVYLSPFPCLAFSELPALLNSADVGIAFYVPQGLRCDFSAGNNIRYIGMSSGKLASYLQNGLPILVNEIGEMSEHTRCYGLGYVVENLDDIGKTLKNITRESLERCRKNIHAYYGSKLCLDVTIAPLLKVLSRLSEIMVAEKDKKKYYKDVCGGFLTTSLESLHHFAELPVKNGAYMVSAIVSTYNSEIFMRGCLEDLTTQTLFADGRLEIVVVDSASPQNECAIVSEFKEQFGDRIVYIRTDERETIYQAWNRGIKAASGKYITNANTDDRHRGDALEVMAAKLEANPDVALVYGDCFVTCLPNQTFEHHVRCGYHMRPDYQPEIMLSGCHMGPQPMWRKSVHDEIGYFSEQYGSAGDYEFWCRVAAKYRLMHIPKFLGLYYENPRGFANSDARLSVQETISIQQFYADRFPPPARDYSMNYQYQGVVSSNSHVNICMVTCNNLPGLTEVIKSLVRNTDYPHMINVADMGSSDGTRDFLLGLKKDGLLTNLLLLDGNITIAEIFAQLERCGLEAGFQLVFGNSIVADMPGWLSAFVMEAQNCPAPFMTNRIWSRDRAIKSPAGMLPAYVLDDNMETSCCMKIAACPTRV